MGCRCSKQTWVELAGLVGCESFFEVVEFVWDLEGSRRTTKREKGEGRREKGRRRCNTGRIQRGSLKFKLRSDRRRDILQSPCGVLIQYIGWNFQILYGCYSKLVN